MDRTRPATVRLTCQEEMLKPNTTPILTLLLIILRLSPSAGATASRGENKRKDRGKGEAKMTI